MLYFIAYPRLDLHGVDHAIKTLQQALAIDPVSFDARIGLARMYELQGQVTKAIEVLEGGDRWAVTRQYAPPAYLGMLANLKLKAGDKAGAEKMRKATQDRVENLKSRIDEQSRVDIWIKSRIDRLLDR